MATTTTAAVNTNDQPEAYAGNGGGVQLRHIQLSRIVVPDGFNPRGEVQDDRELEQMAESIRVDGCLQPIRVRATDTGDFVLISGERRYRAAVKAAVMELPAIIGRPAPTMTTSTPTCSSRRCSRTTCGATWTPFPAPAATSD